MSYFIDMKKRRYLFPILMLCPFLIANAPVPGVYADKSGELSLSITHLGSDTLTRKSLYEFVFTNKEKHPAEFPKHLHFDVDGKKGEDDIKILSTDYSSFNFDLLLPNRSHTLIVETDIASDFTNITTYRADFYTNMDDKVVCSDYEIKPLDQLTGENFYYYYLDCELSNTNNRNYAYLAVIDATYKGQEATFGVQMENNIIYYGDHEEIDLSQLEIRIQSFYKDERYNAFEEAGKFLLNIFLTVFIITFAFTLIGVFIASTIVGIHLIKKFKKKKS